MKNKQKILRVILIALLVATLCFALVACDGSLKSQIDELQKKVNGYEADFAEKTVTVYIGDGEDNAYSVKTRQAFLLDLLKEMKKNGVIDVLEIDETTTPYVKSIGSLAPSGGEYCSLWHSVNEFAFKSVYSGFLPGHGQQIVEGEGQWATTFVGTKIGEKTLYYSNVGVALLPVQDGACYAIYLDTY